MESRRRLWVVFGNDDATVCRGDVNARARTLGSLPRCTPYAYGTHVLGSEAPGGRPAQRGMRPEGARKEPKRPSVRRAFDTPY
jgi:hypothetical protein